jgi:hypothetical protein
MRFQEDARQHLENKNVVIEGMPAESGSSSAGSMNGKAFIMHDSKKVSFSGIVNHITYFINVIEERLHYGQSFNYAIKAIIRREHATLFLNAHFVQQRISQRA